MTLQSKNAPELFTPTAFLNADDLRAATFVRHVEIHDTLDSTNNRAAELARDASVELPALVVARHQTAGRGRGTNTWWSADGALTFSLLLEPATFGIATANWPQLSLVTAVAVCDALEAVCREQGAGSQSDSPTPRSPLLAPRLKWPNDVLIAGRKIAGILLESPGGRGSAKDRLILGLGLNINNTMQNAAPDAVANATSLCEITGRDLEIQAVLVAVLREMASRIDQLRKGDIQLVRRWQDLNFLAGQEICIDVNGRTTTGRCIEIAADGALVVNTSGGIRRLYSGSVLVV